MATSPLSRADLAAQFISGARLTHAIAQSIVSQLPQQSNLNASTFPTVDDDSSLGYEVGSLWIDTNNGKIYLCVESQIGSAEWVALGLFDETEDAKLDSMRVFSESDEAKLDNIIYPAVDTSIRTVDEITSDSTLTSSNDLVLVNALAGPITITLPPASDITGQVYDIKKIDSSENQVTIDGDSSETIDGDTTAVLTSQRESITIVSDGSNWIII